MISRTSLPGAVMAALITASVPLFAQAADRPDATIIKNPQCGCCESYADYLRQNGFKVTVKESHDLPLMKREMSVPDDFASCHTMVLDKYVVEGHVPVSAIDKLLAERPDIKGISLPGMPQGSPGMSGTKAAPFIVYQFGKGPAKVFTVE
ncbi:DUF411 domain-containing protein [bacterium SCSIO 12827]|nr:DUF411 domain-containing protein [bacterium SCSIO 12827]